MPKPGDYDSIANAYDARWLRASLADYSRKRDVVWISNEGPGVTPDLDRVAPARPDLKFRLGRTVFSGGRGESQLVALSHFHGWDLEWLADRSSSAT